MKYIMASFVILGALAACGGGGGDSAVSASETGTSSPAPLGASTSTPAPTPAPPVSSAGDNGGTATEALQISAKVNGVVVAGYPANSSTLPLITLTSGQELELISSMPTVSASSLNGAVAAVRTNTATTWKAVLAAGTDTTATLTFSTTAAPLRTRTVQVAVKAARFQPVVPKVGDAVVYSETATLANKNAYRFDSTTQRVTAVSADGSWVEDYLTSANVLIGAASYDSQGNRTRFRTAATSAQNCDDQGSKLSLYTPGEILLAFPLGVGNTFSGAWKTSCGTDTTVTNSQDESLSATVVGYEAVTTAAGVFNALRIDQVTTVTNSTNRLLPGGGYRQTVSIWFDPVLGRKIKYSGTRTYNGTLTPTQAGALVETSNAELVSYIRN